MVKRFRLTIKEVGREKPVITTFTGDKKIGELVEFFGLDKPDVEHFNIEEIKD